MPDPNNPNESAGAPSPTIRASVRLPDRIMQFFAYAHLPPHLQEVSKPFGDLALQIEMTVPQNPERTVALRKLLEAKDAAVRAVLYKEPEFNRTPGQNGG